MLFNSICGWLLDSPSSDFLTLTKGMGAGACWMDLVAVGAIFMLLNVDVKCRIDVDSIDELQLVE